MVQLYLLLDCVDGEVARWKQQYLAQRRLPGPGRRLPVRRRACWSASACAPPTCGAAAAIDWLWAFLGTLAALGAILIKAETDLVGVARHQGGLPPVKEAAVRAALLRHGAGPQGRRRAEVPPAGPRHRGVAADPAARGRWTRSAATCSSPGSASPCSPASPLLQTAAAPGVRPRLQQAEVRRHAERPLKVGAVDHHHGQPPRGAARPARLGRQAGRRPDRGRRRRQRLAAARRCPRAYAPSSCRRTSASPAAATSASRRSARPAATSTSLLFLDDDGLLPGTDTAELCREAFAADPRLGIISFRIADPDTGVTQRRHVPRLRASDPMRSSRVTTFLGGANAVRTAGLRSRSAACPTSSSTPTRRPIWPGAPSTPAG